METNLHYEHPSNPHFGIIGSSFLGCLPRCTMLPVLSEAAQTLPLTSGRLPGHDFTVSCKPIYLLGVQRIQILVVCSCRLSLHDAGWMKTCFGCWITVHLFCFAVFLRKLEPLYMYVISFILVVPIVVSTVPLITNTYGPTGE